MRPSPAVRAWLGSLLALDVSCAPKHAAPAKVKIELGVASASRSAPSADPLPALSCDANAANGSGASLLSDAVLRELVARWRLARKNRDFRAYSGLYADHFTGRVSDGASFVDRAAWLRAHETVLALEPALASATLHIAIGAGGAQVTFSPEPGPAPSAALPELFVISTKAGPRIAREAPARAAPNELPGSPGLWLADERFAFLSLAPDPLWAEGAPSYVGENSALNAVTLTRLPKALRAWLGRPVRVLGESGTVCETRLQRFAIRAQISPDLATAEVWEGCADQHAPEPGAIARDIWRLSSIEGRTLVAEFSAPCKGALLAVDPDLTAPPIAAPKPASPELGAAALTAFRQLPAYARIQERFKADSPDTPGAWEDRGGRRSVWSLELPGRTPLLFVSVQVGQGCAHFSASLSALWEVDTDRATTLRLVSVPSAEDGGRLTPRALIDLGSRGGAALLFGPDGVYAARSLLTKTRAGYRQTLLTSVPFFAGCADLAR